MGRSQWIILFLLASPLLVYNNCSRSSGHLDGGDQLSSIGAGEGDFVGQRDYELFSQSPNCSSERVAPIATLQLNGSQSSATLLWNRCNDQGQVGVTYADVWRTPYNPYLAYFDGQVYAAPFLHQGAQDSVYYQEFCSNPAENFDFTIQHVMADLPGESAPLRDWIGVQIHGLGADQPGLRFNGGFLSVDSEGRQLFAADNGTYTFEMGPEYEAGRKQGTLTRPSGNTLLFDCHVEPQN
jgi:hypothetical protein